MSSKEKNEYYVYFKAKDGRYLRKYSGFYKMQEEPALVRITQCGSDFTISYLINKRYTYTGSHTFQNMADMQIIDGEPLIMTGNANNNFSVKYLGFKKCLSSGKREMYYLEYGSAIDPENMIYIEFSSLKPILK